MRDLAIAAAICNLVIAWIWADPLDTHWMLTSDVTIVKLLVVASVINLYIAIISHRMMYLKSYSQSVLASILMMSCAGVCLLPGIFVGLWTLLVLLDEELRRDFYRAALRARRNAQT